MEGWEIWDFWKCGKELTATLYCYNLRLCLFAALGIMSTCQLLMFAAPPSIFLHCFGMGRALVPEAFESLIRSISDVRRAGRCSAVLGHRDMLFGRTAFSLRTAGTEKPAKTLGSDSPFCILSGFLLFKAVWIHGLSALVCLIAYYILGCVGVLVLLILQGNNISHPILALFESSMIFRLFPRVGYVIVPWRV